MEYNDEITRQFYGNVQTVVNNWLLFDGMSIGVADTIANEETYVSIKGHLKEATQKVRFVTDIVARFLVPFSACCFINSLMDFIIPAKLFKRRSKES